MMRARTPKHLGWRWLTAAGVAIAVVTGIVVIGGAKAQNSAPVRDASSKTALQKYALYASEAFRSHSLARQRTFGNHRGRR